MGTIKETILDEFYTRQEHQSCYLVRRETVKNDKPLAPWFVIYYDLETPLQVAGYNREEDARRHFLRLKVQAQTE